MSRVLLALLSELPDSRREIPAAQEMVEQPWPAEAEDEQEDPPMRR